MFTWIQFYNTSGEGCVYLDTVLSYIGEGCVYLDKISICSTIQMEKVVLTWIQFYHTSGEGCVYLDTVLPNIWRRLCLPGYDIPLFYHTSGEGCVYLDKIFLCSTIHLEKVLFTWIRYPSVLPYIWRRLCLAVTIW